MLKTTIVLIATLVLIPIVAFYYDDPLTELQSTMLRTSAYMAGFVSLLCFVVSEITRNYSQTDKLWSIMPVIYVIYFAYASAWEPRVTLMAVLVAIWGIRLTYNFSRRGAYKLKFWTGEEDYRWKVLRADPAFNSKIKWTLFNFFFISFYQNALILLFTLPAVKATGSAVPLGIADWILAVLILIAIAIEFTADQQQWDFQSEKYRRNRQGEPLDGMFKDGFLSAGLWKYVRHPNYTAEQAVWILFYLFTIPATGHILNWSAAGFVLLLLLFQGSADFSEKISGSKYARYGEYQRKVGKFLPRVSNH